MAFKRPSSASLLILIFMSCRTYLFICRVCYRLIGFHQLLVSQGTLMCQKYCFYDHLLLCSLAFLLEKMAFCITVIILNKIFLFTEIALILSNLSLFSDTMFKIESLLLRLKITTFEITTKVV